MEISRQIEALLFFKGESVTVDFLVKALGAPEDNVRAGLVDLKQSLDGRGIVLMQNGDEYMLATAPQMGTTIEKILKDEISKELGKAGLETLAIVLYRGPVARSEINYLRGVNSNYILRALLVRGLIEKDESSTVRSTMYRPTFELLSYLGISSIEELPGYEETVKAVEEFHESNDNDESEDGEGKDITKED